MFALIYIAIAMFLFAIKVLWWMFETMVKLLIVAVAALFGKRVHFHWF